MTEIKIEKTRHTTIKIGSVDPHVDDPIEAKITPGRESIELRIGIEHSLTTHSDLQRLVDEIYQVQEDHEGQEDE